jgi:23S rRNA pseudouridine1911/1915/1917 synthase
VVDRRERRPVIARFTAVRPERLVDVAKAHLGLVPVDAIGPLIATGAVTIGARVGTINDPVAVGDVLAIDLAALPAGTLAPAPMTLAIGYEDDDLIVVDKPSGMHVHPIGAFRDGTALNCLLTHAGARADQPWTAWRPRPVHRLDRATSGLVAFAKHAAIHDAMRAAFDAGQVHRTYRATVAGVIRDDAGTIDAPLARDPALSYRRAVVAGGQPATTRYRVLSRTAETTLVELTPLTGRTHQLRAHLASIGHPILGDTLYATGRSSSAAIELRAVALAFPHPRTGAPIIVTALEPDRTSACP